ncbi:class I SAM-dependent DNA methyltransferase, partial [Rubrivirga sp.]|uniref:class I SAM-dependent DNA methyltransferase n=1 Tax=Rubrivirga sp. TaxID=1885344 RepID=UPI003C736EAF
SKPVRPRGRARSSNPPAPDLVADPYSALAAGYDAVMAHVDYPGWADYLEDVIREHHPDARSIVELGCGTGTLAVALQPLGPDGGYEYRGYDGAPAMVEVARRAALEAGRSVPFETADFLEPVPGPPADVIVLVYDGLNYLLDLEDVETMLGHIRDGLAPGGIAIVDQSTPANSVNHPDSFDDIGEAGAFRYVRSSAYDAETRLHTNTFTLTDPKTGRRTTETHVQRAYGLEEVRGAIGRAGLHIVAAYDGFEVDAATEESERVHWVLEVDAAR